MNPKDLLNLGQLLEWISKDQRLVIIYEEKAILPEETFKYLDKYVVNIRALQFPEGDVGFGITLSDTVVYMPFLTFLGGDNDE